MTARWSWILNRAGGALSAAQLQPGLPFLRVWKVWPDCTLLFFFLEAFLLSFTHCGWWAAISLLVPFLLLSVLFISAWDTFGISEPIDSHCPLGCVTRKISFVISVQLLSPLGRSVVYINSMKTHIQESIKGWKEKERNKDAVSILITFYVWSLTTFSPLQIKESSRALPAGMLSTPTAYKYKKIALCEVFKAEVAKYWHLERSSPLPFAGSGR